MKKNYRRGIMKIDEAEERAVSLTADSCEEINRLSLTDPANVPESSMVGVKTSVEASPVEK